jgi:glycosyltransferase involved in cell wall biosynthesis
MKAKHNEDNEIVVIVPAFNEEIHIISTLAGIPKRVTRVIVINDGSTDNTEKFVLEQQLVDPRIQLINNEQNFGLGHSLIVGYLESQKHFGDVTIVMAGDNQMDPDDLDALIEPVIRDEVDYTKGNRLLRNDVRDSMPGYRFVGNSILTFLTKFATGYWHVVDPQCGYTAISGKALNRIPIATMTKGYGYNAHILNMLNIENLRVGDVSVRPVYGPNTTKIKLRKYIPLILKLLSNLYFKRLFQKYIWRDFHPLVLFYAMAVINSFFIALPLAIRFVYLYWTIGVAPTTTLILLSLSTNIAVLSFFFAIWMDMEANRNVSVRLIDKL